MLPLVCNDAVAILFMFDLSRKSTLNSVKEWYRQARGFNKVGTEICHSVDNFADTLHSQTAIPFLIGTKFDLYSTLPPQTQAATHSQALKFARAMKAPLIFTSTLHSINVQKIFKIVLAKAFDLKCTIGEISGVGEPVVIYLDC